MEEKIKEIPIHDIKPLVEIQEYSLYYFSALMILAALAIAGIVYLLVKYFKSKKAFNVRKEHFKLLAEIDFGDAKKSAYDITLYGATFKNDTLRHLDIYEELTQKLEEYKYKKSVNEINHEVKNYVELYRGMIDV